MIRYATVGTSAITEKFIAGCALTGQFIHEAVYSRSEESGKEFAKRIGCGRVITDLKKLAADERVDAVYVASPNSVHFEQCKLLLENGKHVICESPIVTSADAFLKLKRIADQNRVIFMEAMPPRFAKSRTAVLEALKHIGRISTARIDFSQLSSRYPQLLNGELPNIFNMSLQAGTLMDLGVYCVNAAVDLLGVPNEISATASYLECGADGSGTAIFGYDGFSAVLTYSKIGQSAIGSEIIGDRGTLKIGMISQYADVVLVTADGEERICGVPERAELLSGEASAFADFIRLGAGADKRYEEICRQTLEVHTCMDKIKESAGIQY